MIFSVILTYCGNQQTSRKQAEEAKVENNMKRLEASEAIPVLTTSLERRNIKARLLNFEDINKVSYIYLISFGKVMAFYTVKGKVSSGGKRLTSAQTLIRGDQGEHYGDFVMEAPELDGTYGSSAEYIYFWTTDGTYIQWSDQYMMSDKPLKMTTQPELMRIIDK